MFVLEITAIHSHGLLSCFMNNSLSHYNPKKNKKNKKLTLQDDKLL